MDSSHQAVMGWVRMVAVFALVLVVTVGFIATRVLPGPAACLFVSQAGLQVLPDGTYTDSRSPADQTRFAQLTVAARERITNRFGKPEATPVLVYINDPDGLGPFRLNAFGSTQLLGPHACVMIGAKGQNVDVVAHEFMHAEIHQRAGFWYRFMQIPAWLDEGLAMQVDDRPQYALTAEVSQAKDSVRRLTSSSDFFKGDEQAVIRHYALARALVADWVARVGRDTIFVRLQQHHLPTTTPKDNPP